VINWFVASFYVTNSGFYVTTVYFANELSFVVQHKNVSFKLKLEAVKGRILLVYQLSLISA